MKNMKMKTVLKLTINKLIYHNVKLLALVKDVMSELEICGLN